ncbi:MAG TPA: hypothetical protein VLB12_11585 [Gemmatimonadales bacterium]|nr:hypothetical protein [Gemmatimonadales bacterium]
MCAYNIRSNRRVDHDPAAGTRRFLNLLREIVIVLIGLATLYGVYRLVRIYLF